ncbi:MAG: TolC family protein [Polyangiaceae bacterium]
MRARHVAAVIIGLECFANVGFAADSTITYRQALNRAAHVSPDLVIARTRESVARAEIGIAGTLPNPSISVGTSSQTARLSGGVTVPLLILGQRGAAIDASTADFTTTRVETEVTAVDVRASVAHAYVALWRAQGIVIEEERSAAIAQHLETDVQGRVDLGAAANVDGLRAHAERLRADAQAQQSSLQVSAAASDLGAWFGIPDAATLRAQDPPEIPAQPPALADLQNSIGDNPAVRRERADTAAAEARVTRERALVRPILIVDLGFDAYDDTLCPGVPCSNPPVNYRGALGVEVPFLSQRGGYIEREQANAASGRARESAQRLRLAAALASSYRTFDAWRTSTRALADGVVPAADAAAAAAEESYTLGRAPLVAVLDAEKARVEANLSLLEARSQTADAWIDVEHAIGTR